MPDDNKVLLLYDAESEERCGKIKTAIKFHLGYSNETTIKRLQDNIIEDLDGVTFLHTAVILSKENIRKEADILKSFLEKYPKTSVVTFSKSGEDICRDLGVSSIAILDVRNQGDKNTDLSGVAEIIAKSWKDITYDSVSTTSGLSSLKLSEERIRKIPTESMDPSIEKQEESGSTSLRSYEIISHKEAQCVTDASSHPVTKQGTTCSSDKCQKTAEQEMKHSMTGCELAANNTPMFSDPDKVNCDDTACDTKNPDVIGGVEVCQGNDHDDPKQVHAPNQPMFSTPGIDQNIAPGLGQTTIPKESSKEDAEDVNKSQEIGPLRDDQQAACLSPPYYTPGVDQQQVPGIGQTVAPSAPSQDVIWSSIDSRDLERESKSHAIHHPPTGNLAAEAPHQSSSRTQNQVHNSPVQMSPSQSQPGPGQMPQGQGQPSPGQMPKGQYQPGPGQIPQGQSQLGPGQMLQGQCQPGPGQMPQGQYQPGPGQMPQGQSQLGPGQIPQGQSQPGPGQMPQGQYLPGPGQMPQGQSQLGPGQMLQGQGQPGPDQMPQGQYQHGPGQMPQGQSQLGPGQIPQGQSQPGPGQMLQGECQPGPGQMPQSQPPSYSGQGQVQGQNAQPDVGALMLQMQQMQLQMQLLLPQVVQNPCQPVPSQLPPNQGQFAPPQGQPPQYIPDQTQFMMSMMQQMQQMQQVLTQQQQQQQRPMNSGDNSLDSMPSVNLKQQIAKDPEAAKKILTEVISEAPAAASLPPSQSSGLNQNFRPIHGSQQETGANPTAGAASGSESGGPTEELRSVDLDSSEPVDKALTPVLRLPNDIKKGLKIRLDPDRSLTRNWEYIAERRGLTYEEIKYIKSGMPGHYHSYFFEMLDHEKCQGYTVQALEADLEKIQRRDVLHYLREKHWIA